MSLDQRMWGSNATLAFPIAGAPVDLPDVQLADVPLPESCVASIFFQAEVVAPPSLVYAISYITLTLNLGLGRVTVVRPITWNGVPRSGVPIVFTLPFVPAKMVLASVRGGGNSFGSEPAQVLCTLEVAPISRFPMADPLKFGMAKPGEADGLDDELLDDLESHSPDEADIMRAAQDEGHDPAEALAEHEGRSRGPSHIPHEMMPPRVSRVVRSLTKRLGRPPRLRELPPWAQKELHSHIKRGAR